MEKANTSRLRLLACALLLCIIPPSCRAPEVADGVFATADPNRTALTDADDTLYDYDLKTVPYAYTNMLASYSGASVCDAGERVLFSLIANQSWVLFAFDKHTGKMTTFCKDASCDHNSPSCSAYGIAAMELHNGKIYGQRVAAEGPAAMELRGDRFVPILEPAGFFRHYENDLYVAAADGVFLRYANSSTKNPEIILEDMIYYSYTIIDGYFYYSTENSAICRFPLDNPSNVEKLADSTDFRTEGEYIYYADKSYLLHRCNLDGSNTVRLTDMLVFPPSVNFDAEYMYFMGNDRTDDTAPARSQLYRIKRGTQEAPELIVDTGLRVLSIYPIHATDYLFLSVYGGMYVINKDGTGLRELTLE